MYTYGFSLIISAFCAYVASRSCVAYGNKSKEQRYYYNVLIILSACPLVFTAAFRYGVGTDFFSYQTIFESIYNTNQNFYNVDIGFYWLNLLVAQFTENSQAMFALCAALYVFFSYKFMQLQPANFYWSVLLFVLGGYYFIFMNTMKQYMAIAIVSYALKYVKEEKILQFIFFVMLGSLFHLSVAIIVIVYPFRKTFVKLRTQILAILFSVAVLPSVVLGIKWIVDSFFPRYSIYLERQNLLANELYVFAMILINVSVLLYYHYCNSDTSGKYGSWENILLVMQLIAVFTSITMMYIPLAERVLQIFTFQQLFGIPFFSNKLGKFRSDVFLICWCIGMGAFSFLNLVIYQNHEVFPYHSIF